MLQAYDLEILFLRLCIQLSQQNEICEVLWLIPTYIWQEHSIKQAVFAQDWTDCSSFEYLKTITAFPCAVFYHTYLWLMAAAPIKADLQDLTDYLTVREVWYFPSGK